MPSLNILDDNAFELMSLTAEVNEQPYTPGQIGASGIFEEDGITTTSAMIDHLEGNLSLIEPTPRGGPGETAGDDDRKTIPFVIDHYQRDDFIKADEVQNVRAFGRESEVETVMGRVMAKTRRHLTSLDTTIEHQRVGAIKGVVTSKSGKQLHNLYTMFDIAPPAPVTINFDQSTAKLRTQFYDILCALEDDLEADTYERFDVYCGKNSWINLIDSEGMRETYLNAQQAAELRGLPLDSVEFGNFNFIRYRTGAKASAAAGGAPFIGDNEGRIVPVGVPGLFITRFAPADYEETVNTVGLPRYMQQFPAANNKGRALEIQSNATSLCTRPQALRQLVMGS